MYECMNVRTGLVISFRPPPSPDGPEDLHYRSEVVPPPSIKKDLGLRIAIMIYDSKINCMKRIWLWIMTSNSCCPGVPKIRVNCRIGADGTT